MDVAVAKKETGERLKKVRESLGLTQGKFSEILGISVTLYKKMEGGSYNISVKTLRKLKQVTGVSVDYIMFGEGNEFKDIWFLLQNSENRTKLKVLLRLLMYFGYNSEEFYTERKKEEEYSALIDRLLEEDKLGELAGKNETSFDS